MKMRFFCRIEVDVGSVKREFFFFLSVVAE